MNRQSRYISKLSLSTPALIALIQRICIKDWRTSTGTRKIMSRRGSSINAPFPFVSSIWEPNILIQLNHFKD